MWNARTQKNYRKPFPVKLVRGGKMAYNKPILTDEPDEPMSVVSVANAVALANAVTYINAINTANIVALAVVATEVMVVVDTGK